MSNQNKGNQKPNTKLNQTMKTSFLKRGNSIIDSQPSLTTLVKKFSTINKQCKLCEKIYTQQEMDCFGSCQHYFCHFCIVQYCTYKIDIKDHITCPQEGCKSVLQENSDAFTKLPKDAKRKYRKLASEQKQQHITFKRCPSEHCKGTINIETVPIYCKQCKVTFCQTCLLPKHEGQCSQYFQKKFQKWKCCPECSTPTEKHDEETNLATCPRQHKFCFVCLKKWTKKQKHENCVQRTSNLQQCKQKVKNIPRWLSFILALIMIPLFPVVSLLWIAFSLIVVVLLTIAITAGCLFALVKQFKQTGFNGAISMWILAQFMVLGSFWWTTVDFSKKYFVYIKALYSPKQKHTKSN